MLSEKTNNKVRTCLPLLLRNTLDNFRAGKILNNFSKWQTITSDHWVLNNVKGLNIPFNDIPTQNTLPPQIQFSVTEKLQIQDEIHKLINKGVISKVQHTTGVNRGVRQGDPISSYIFLLCAEILNILIENNKSLEGIVIGNKEYKISQFANDTTLILNGKKSSLNEALEILKYFAKISGLEINENKCKTVWIGCKKFSGETFNHRYKFDFKTKHFTMLGITFSTDLEEMICLNYNKRIEEIKMLLKQWSTRNITTLGRITVVKTLVISKLNYLFLTIPDPEKNLLTLLNRLFYDFIWNSKPDRIKEI